MAMPFDPAGFSTALTAALDSFDKEAVTACCDQLIAALYDLDNPVPAPTLEYTLQALRNKRMFVLMQKLGDCFIQLGLQTYKIRRQYAQALIDQGIYAAPLAILQQLRAETRPDADPAGAKEYAEATGLVGRIYKQQYVNTSRPADPRIANLLKRAINSYQEVYLQDPISNPWHGINLVALIARAGQDRLDFKGLPDPKTIAAGILDNMQKRCNDKEARAWDFATAIEACIALGNRKEAVIWTDRYIRSNADAFEIASTLRQIQEVWGLDMTSEVGHDILPLLNAALLQREGGSVELSTGELAQQRAHDPDYIDRLQGVLGADSFKTYEWYVKGLKVCSAVARIGETNIVGTGSGFLLDGALVHPNLKGQTVLFTNAHVVSADPTLNAGSLKPEQAVATLEAVDPQSELKFEKIHFTSSFQELDTTILVFDKEAQDRLRSSGDSIFSYPLAAGPPATDGKQRVYVIGYPRGGTLRISLQDNIFLSMTQRYLQYRTPTDHGSSGSPVFNDKWELIGIHHAGGFVAPVPNQPGRYMIVNEGIRIDTILSQL